MKKYTRVTQVGFDIAEGSSITEQDRQDLAEAISNLINTFYDINGKALDFECVNGHFSFEDMSHAYGESELKTINEPYQNLEQ